MTDAPAYAKVESETRLRHLDGNVNNNNKKGSNLYTIESGNLEAGPIIGGQSESIEITVPNEFYYDVCKLEKFKLTLTVLNADFIFMFRYSSEFSLCCHSYKCFVSLRLLEFRHSSFSKSVFYLIVDLSEIPYLKFLVDILWW